MKSLVRVGDCVWTRGYNTSSTAISRRSATNQRDRRTLARVPSRSQQVVNRCCVHVFRSSARLNCVQRRNIWSRFDVAHYQPSPTPATMVTRSISAYSEVNTQQLYCYCFVLPLGVAGATSCLDSRVGVMSCVQVEHWRCEQGANEQHS